MLTPADQAEVNTLRWVANDMLKRIKKGLKPVAYAGEPPVCWHSTWTEAQTRILKRLVHEYRAKANNIARGRKK